ncbi:MAG: tetratricopeptide repeat protein, partial [Candidatus Magnetomorum sp.]|nr:tetratricopeptide repeat protein [Candidatus Magnetomorum sp.]
MQHAIEKLTALYQKGDFSTGLCLAKDILKKDPQNPYVNHFIGLHAFNTEDFDTAITFIHRSIEHFPDNAEFHCNLGEVYREQKKYSEAIACHQKALAINPEHIRAYYQLGLVFQLLNEHKKAVECYQNCFTYQPDHMDAVYNANFSYQSMGQYVNAIKCCQKVIQSNLNHHKAWNDMGVACHKLGDYSLARHCFEKSLLIEPSSPLAHENRAVLKLLAGDYPNGFLEYQWFRKQVFETPLSLSDTINGKRLLVHAERGFGDTIQFARYLPLLKKKGAFVIFQLPRELFRLFSGSHIADQYLIDTQKELPTVDATTGIMFLPCFFQTSISTVPSETPYLKAPETIKRLLRETIQENQRGFNIGIVWAGNSQNENDLHRSTSLEMFLPIARLPGIRLFSFQKDPVHRQELKSLPEDISITDVGAVFEDFADTASAIQQMNLMICVETSAAHLSGSMGHPTWLLLPAIPDWRWLLEQDKSPWYPEMKLFRQKKDGNWQDVIDRVKTALEPIMVDYFYQKGMEQINQKTYSQACQYFEYITLINPDHFDAWFQMGNACMKQQHVNQGIEYYEKAVNIQPNHAICQYNSGRAWYARRDYKKAIEFFQK